MARRFIAPNSIATAQFASQTTRSRINSNQRLVSASAGFMPAHLAGSDPNVFNTAQAALHDFVESTDNFFSPFSWTEGVPQNPFSKGLMNKVEAFKTYVSDPFLGTAPPSPHSQFDGAFKQLANAVSLSGGYVGVINIQTQGYHEPTWFLGLPWGGGWKNDAPIQMVISNGPALGRYITPGRASVDAATALQVQLLQMGYVRPSQPSF